MLQLNPELARTAYDTHLSAALALPPERLLPYRVEPDLAINNVNLAMAVVDKHGEQIPVDLPSISVAELRALPSMAMAVKVSAMFAQGAVPGEVSASEIIAEGWKLRGILMPVVEGLAATGAIPRKVFEHIQRGRGARDMAEDCVSLSHVFRDYAAEVAGKHNADPAIIARAEVVGSWLLQNMRKQHARRSATFAAEVDIRDRMATLLVETYNKLRIVGYYYYQDELNEHVPLLMSRQIARKRDTEPAAETL